MSVCADNIFMQRELTDSFAVVDITTGGNIVSFVCNPKNSFYTEDNLFDILHGFEDKLNKALFSYESRPILLGDKENIAFVLPNFTASTGMYLVAVPNVSPRSASFAIQSGSLDDILVLGELAAFTRVSKRMREEAKMLKGWLDGSYRCFALRGENDSQVFDEFLRSRISSISEYVGVNARIVTVDKVRENKNFDLGLFLAFVTVMLMFARMRSRDNSVLVSIGEDDHGIFVSVDLSFDSQVLRYDREMLVFKGMVDRKRVLFEAIEKNDSISIKISPIIEDWSLLELKVPDNEETEFELT